MSGNYSNQSNKVISHILTDLSFFRIINLFLCQPTAKEMPTINFSVSQIITAKKNKLKKKCGYTRRRLDVTKTDLYKVLC